MKQVLTDLRHLIQRRYLIQLWLRYRIQVRYTQTFLGIVWVIALPILSVGVYAFAIGEVLGAKELVDVPYVPFLLSGHLLFGIFSTTLLNCRGAYVNIMDLANQIYFPREIVLVLVLGEALVDFFFAFVAMLVINSFFGIYPSLSFLLVPIPLFVMCMWSLGLALIISWWSVRVRDFQPLLVVVVQLLFFLTPILYEPAQIPGRFQPLMVLNPLARIINTWRALMLGTGSPQWAHLALTAIPAAFLLVFGYGFFKRREKQIMDYQ